jgi:hypothetical protein
MTALGDFGAQTETLESFTLFLIFFLACLIILIVMMNLLIGMISERLAEVLEQKEKNDQFELCQLISDLENIMFWKRGNEDKDSYYRHFTWSSYQQMPEEWEGRVKATTAPIDKAVKAQGKMVAAASNQVDSHLTVMENSLEAVNQDIRNAVDAGREDMNSKLSEFEIRTTRDFEMVKDAGTTSKKAIDEFKEEICGVAEEKAPETQATGEDGKVDEAKNGQNLK